MSTPAFNVPLNNLSFGNVSIAILREVFRRGLQPNVLPIGPVDLSAQKPDDSFNRQLGATINDAQRNHSREDIVFRLWHIQGSLESYSRRDSRLLTFFELDALTPTEINILRNQDKVYVTSSYTRDVFGMFGINAEYVPLGFDAHNFSTLAARPLIDGVTSFLLAGKLEKRKGHFKVLNLWAKKYGNNMKYRLNLALFNPFMPVHRQQAMINEALEGKQYANIGPRQPDGSIGLPYMPTNAEYNSFLQSGQIYIAMSGGEGRGLPEYHATALGAWPVALNAHAYKDYLTTENAVLVNPNSKVPAADGVFFAPNGPFNIGNLFDFNGDEFVAACETAEARAAQGLNAKGFELQKITYKDTVDALLKDAV